ncbi:hypothetical protein Pmani_021539 [Petrolisthes manimaculis]|uniref:HTH psq-type domain-containing protein n=2 Tax=Petrolisthes manimaculis TaxID=1843537 RepID=A0AAE1PEQ8_9EUCA|nr:hypothetical protein Pmani_021539 [Petrolisthes manimaculis]
MMGDQRGPARPSRVGIKHSQWTREDMQRAIKACKTGMMTPSQAAKEYNVPRKTLTDRLQRKVSEDCTNAGRKRALTPGQEKDLCRFIEYMAMRGFPLTVNQILMLAWCIDKVQGRKVFGASGPCEGWWRSFRNKYPDATKLRRPDRLDRGRALYSTVDKIRDYFQLLKQQLTEGDYMARPQDIYNCDESIVDLNKCTQRVVVPKRMRHAHSREVASSEHISIHCCVSASGHAMPPFIIFKQSFPGGNYSRDGPDGCLYGKQDSGFMDSELFLQWFEQLFIVHSRPSPDRPVLILLDGHISHCSPHLIESAIRHNVTLFALAPHTTHICQPLDVAVYKSFKSHLDKLVNLGKAIKGNFWVPKKNIPTMLKGPFESSMTMANIKSGFRKCGVFPFNPNAVDKTLLMRNKLIPNTDVDLSEPPAQAFVTTGTQTDNPLQGVPNVPVPHVTPSKQTDDPPQGVPNVPVPHVTLSTQTDDPPQKCP